MAQVFKFECTRSRFLIITFCFVKDACKPGGSAKRAEKEQELASSTIFTEPASNNEAGQDYGGYDIVKATQVITT